MWKPSLPLIVAMKKGNFVWRNWICLIVSTRICWNYCVPCNLLTTKKPMKFFFKNNPAPNVNILKMYPVEFYAKPILVPTQYLYMTLCKNVDFMYVVPLIFLMILKKSLSRKKRWFYAWSIPDFWWFLKKSLLCKKVDFMYVSGTSYLLFVVSGYRKGGSADSLRESRLIHMYLLLQLHA